MLLKLLEEEVLECGEVNDKIMLENKSDQIKGGEIGKLGDR